MRTSENIPAEWHFDRLIDRINLVPKILADILTKGSFIREWNRLIRPFNVMDELSFNCSHSRIWSFEP